jgi:chemotaxis protein MotA
VVKKLFKNRLEDHRKLIALIVSLAETARRDGLLALENRLEEIHDPFLVLGIQMAVDGIRPEVIQEVLNNEMAAMAARHQKGKLLFERFGKYGPAFGMLGTLIGLIIMLGNMKDPDAIGPGMAVALITTFYGSIVANVFALPMADKLASLSKHEMLGMEIILRGVMSIQSGDNPRVIEQKLSTFLPPNQRGNLRKAA